MNIAAGVAGVTRGGGESFFGELHPGIRTTAMMQRIRIPGTMLTAILFILIFSPSFFTTSPGCHGSGTPVLKINQRFLTSQGYYSPNSSPD